MKIERISDNQIRCTLNSLDLSSRNLNLGELAYGSEKARNLFREMIQQASNEVGFEAEDIPLMVEAIPLSSESVMLVITKIEDPEELDSRFAKFSPFSEEESLISSSFASEYLEGAEPLMEALAIDEDQSAQEKDPVLPDSSSQPESTKSVTRIYSFHTLDDIISASQSVGQVSAIENTLYKNQQANQYYLVLRQYHTSSVVFSQICNLLAEFGTKVKFEYSTEAYYQEHYEVIIKKQALQTLSELGRV